MPWRPRGVRRVLVASLVTVVLVGGGCVAAARWPAADAPRATPPPAVPPRTTPVGVHTDSALDCPGGHSSGAAPYYVSEGGRPLGDPTSAAAVARLDEYLRRHLATATGNGFV